MIAILLKCYFIIFVKNKSMNFELNFKVTEKLYLKNPDSSDLGKQIVKKGIDLIYELGFENFTFKKLALEIKTTEASIYRYFENKHRLLLYILNWYWFYMEFLVLFKINNFNDPINKLNTIIELFTHELPESLGKFDYNKKYLNLIVIRESSKTYLVKEIEEINKDQVFKPYKDLCSKIAEIIIECNPAYKFPRSLGSTIIEASHNQQYFSNFLPKLTDINDNTKSDYTCIFLKDLISKILK